MKFRLIFMFCVVFALSCTKRYTPEGKDDKGFFIYVNRCVESYSTTRLSPFFNGKIVIMIPITSTYCTKKEKVKKYIDSNKIKQP